MNLSAWNKKIAQSFSGIPQVIVILALGGFLANAGSTMVWPINITYIHFVLGKSLTVAGLVLTLQAGAGILGQMLGGVFYDRIGGKPVMLAGLLSAMSMLLVIGLVRIWPVYILAMTILGFSYGMVEPATNALVAGAWPKGGRRGFNFLYVARNAGVAVGATTGGILAQISFKLPFFANAILLAGYILVLVFLIPRNIPASVPTESKTSGTADHGADTGTVHFPGEQRRIPAWVLLDMGFLVLGVIVVWVAYSQWWAVVSVYMQNLGYSLASYSALWTINGVLIVVGQPILSFAVKRWLKGTRSQLTAGACLFAVSFGLMWLMPRYWWFFTAMVIGTFGEMLVLPALPAAVSELAPRDREGLFQGVLGSAGSAGRMLGPVGGGYLFDRMSAGVVLGAATSLFVAGAGLFGLFGILGRKRAPAD